MSTTSALQPAALRASAMHRSISDVRISDVRISDKTYRRRRLFVGATLAVITACSVVFAQDVLAGSGGVPASAAASQPAHTRSSIVARPGDTLWSIAEAHRGTVSINRFVDKMVDLNGGASIQAGQQIVLP